MISTGVDTAPFEPREPRKAAVACALIVLVIAGVGLRAAFFSGYPGTDDASYIEAAYRVSMGDRRVFDTQFSVRTGLVMPTAAAYHLVGVNPLTTVWWPFVCSVGAMSAAFAFGRRLFDVPTGLLAAALLVIFPLDAIFATELFGCVPVELLAGLSAFLLVRDHRASSPWFAAGAGACLGLAMITAETTLFCLIPASYYFIVMRRRLDRATAFAFALFVVIATESMLYVALVGDPWTHWREASKAVAVQGRDVLEPALSLSYLLHPLARLVSEQELGLFPVLLVPAVWWHVRRSPSPYSRFLALWVVSLFLYSWYGTTSPFRFAPLPRLPRYLAPTVIPALVLLASFLRSWQHEGRRHAVIGALIVTSVACIWVDNGRHVKDDRRALHAFIAGHPTDRFALDRALIFDELLFRGFRQGSPLAVLAERGGEGETQADAPPWLTSLPIVKDLRQAEGMFVVVTESSMRETVGADPRAELVETFQPPDRIYYRLLRSPAFLRLFSLVRDSYRVHGMRDVGRERIEVYRLRTSVGGVRSGSA